MSYVGDSLASFVRTAKRPTREAGRHLAEAGVDRLATLTRQNTPVDTGRLRASWKTKAIVKALDERGRIVWSTGVESEVEYAPDVEYGTGLWGPKHAKYLIVPKHPGGVLHWIDRRTGEHVWAKKVWHPGSPGQHMVAIAIAKTESELEEISHSVLGRWKAEFEAAWRARAR